MPELPEVETVSKALNISITNYIIKKVEVFKPNLRVLVSKNINVISKDSTIFSVKRRAKYGKIYLDNEYVIVFHLGMSGRIIIDRPESYLRQKHDHIVFHLKSSKATKKDIRLIFNDPRRFGFLNVYKNNSPDFKNIFKELGPEPLTANFNKKALQNILFKRGASIKSVLLNQKLIAGLGNIYVCESLFASKISPNIKASELNKKEIKTLLFKIKLL